MSITVLEVRNYPDKDNPDKRSIYIRLEEVDAIEKLMPGVGKEELTTFALAFAERELKSLEGFYLAAKTNHVSYMENDIDLPPELHRRITTVRLTAREKEYKSGD